MCFFEKFVSECVHDNNGVLRTCVCVWGGWVGGGGGWWCNIPLYIFLCLQYVYLYYTCVLRLEFGHVWLLPTGLFTETAACKSSP